MRGKKGSKRIALMGFNLESNKWSPVVGKADFHEYLHLVGDEIVTDSDSPNPRALATMSGFMHTMDKLMDWTPTPIILSCGGAAGPADHAFLEEFMAESRQRLEAAMPIDGVYFSEHGAATTTKIFDPDGEFFEMVRKIVGPKVPLVSTLDLHANISERMVDTTDILISYLTNPHVDMLERGIEAANAMRELFDGVKTEKAFIRLPLAPPNVTQRTDIGPYADAINYGQSKVGGPIMNVSILGGFHQGDTPKNGMAFIVTSRGDLKAARKLCRDIAERTWKDRQRFVPKLTSLADCVKLAIERTRDPKVGPVLLADVADNPGGGGRGNTTWLLDALHKAGAKGVILGPFFDPALAAEAHGKGKGAKFRALFNRDETNEHSKTFEAEATVVNLADGVFVGREGGVGGGRTIELGPTAVLDVGGIQVVVVSFRKQCLDSNHFEAFGVDVGKAKTVIVKSRGHFRAGFKHLFKDEQIFEADLPGLCTPNWAHYRFEGLPRPIFPLDKDATWQPPNW